MITTATQINSIISANSISDVQIPLNGIVVGFVICLICVFTYFFFTKKKRLNIEDGVMTLSFFGATACLIISLFFSEVDKSINILSFFCSFVFSWLLTKKSSKQEFKELQQEIAKTSYRHIGDVRKATLVTKNRLSELKNKDKILNSDIDGILDDVEIILQCIVTNEDDWKDMVSKELLEQMKKDEDPEGEDIEQNKKEHKLNTNFSLDFEQISKEISEYLKK
jgi:Ca2+/Na+ antiporter